MIAGFLVLLGSITLLLLVAAYWRGYKAGMGYGVLGSKAELVATRQALADQKAELTQVAEHCRLQWVDWEKRAESYRSINSGILDERDKWQRLYDQQSAAHGNAQGLMMGAIDYMGKKLHAAGITFQIPPVLEEVRQQFIHSHVTSMLPKPYGADTEHGQDLSEKVQQKVHEVG